MEVQWVVIVGGGPVGLVAAMDLATRGGEGDTAQLTT